MQYVHRGYTSSPRGSQWLSGLESQRSDQTALSPMLEGEGLILVKSGHFSPLIIILVVPIFQLVVGCCIFSPGTPLRCFLR